MVSLGWEAHRYAGGGMMSTAADRTQIHQLVDALPERDLKTAQRVLHGLLALDAGSHDSTPWDVPEDEEVVTEADILAEAEADADIVAGRLVSHAEARRILLGTSDLEGAMDAPGRQGRGEPGPSDPPPNRRRG
jgi:hypothetical protein